jgi:hypothetical protein
MKTRPGAFAILGLTAFLAAASVCAEPGDRRLGRRFGDRDGFDGARAERIERLREFRRNESALGRMSPEERRQLRHDIRAARDGVYRRPPPPPPLPPGLQEGPPR